MERINQDIATKNFKNVYLLYGEESYLKNQYKKKLQGAILPAGDTMNLTVYQGKDFPVLEMIDQAETMPFFSDRRLIILENTEMFSREAPEKLEDYIKKIPESAILLFVEDKVDKRSRLFKAVKSAGREVDFIRLKSDMLIRWILQILKREGKNITRATMELFLEKTGDDMGNISMELEKLLCYTMGEDVITSEHVEEICTTQIVNKIFAMIDAIAERQQKRALDLYYDLLTLKEGALRILALITRQFRILILIKELRDQGYNGNTLAEKAGVPAFTVKNYVRQAGYFSMNSLRKGLELMADAEEAVKTGQMKDTMAVELVIVQMSRAPKR